MIPVLEKGPGTHIFPLQYTLLQVFLVLRTFLFMALEIKYEVSFS